MKNRFSLKTFSPFHLDLSAKETDIPEHILRSLQYSVWEGGLTGTMAVMTGGVVLTGLALSLGATEIVIGMIASLQAGANLLQFRAFRTLEKRGNRREQAINFAVAARLMWIAICVVVLIDLGTFDSYRIWLFLILFAAAGALGIFSVVPWLAWHVDLVPQKVRGRFFAQRNAAAGSVGIVLGVLAGQFIDWWKEKEIASEPLAFVILILIGVGFGLWAVRFIAKMHHPTFLKPEIQPPFWHSLRTPFRDPRFRRLFFFRVFYDLSLGMSGTFFGVYMLKQLELSFTFVSVLAMTATLANLSALKFWGRAIDKFGSKPILKICMAGKLVYAVLWIFTTPSSIWLLVLIHLFGVFDAGNGIAIPALLYKIAPEKKRANYIAVDGTVVGLAATISPLIGGALAESFSGWQFSLGAIHLAHFHFLFLASAVMRVGTLVILHRVQEPKARTIALIVRVLRPVRGLDVFEGFQQALHSTFIPSARYFVERVIDRTTTRRSKKR